MFRDLFVYLRIIFFNWYLLILLIPDLFWITQTYFNFQMKLPSFIDNYLWIWAFLFFFVASFNAWRELKSKSQNKVNYELNYIVEEIYWDLDEDIKKAQSEIQILNSKINTDNANINSSNRYVTLLFGIPKDKKLELENYIAELTNLKKHYKQWKKVTFFIKNVGTVYDSNINVNMKVRKWVVLENYELEYNLKNPPNYPENKESNSLYFPGISDNKNTPPYRVKKTDWEYELRDLHIGSEAEIFYAWEWIIVEIGELEIDFEISSRNTNEVIKKNIKIKVG